jgi:hypothetical protein
MGGGLVCCLFFCLFSLVSLLSYMSVVKLALNQLSVIVGLLVYYYHISVVEKFILGSLLTD